MKKENGVLKILIHTSNMKIKFKVRGETPLYRADIPDPKWLHDEQSYARSIGANEYGTPAHSTVTGYFLEDLSSYAGATPIIPLAMLDNVKGVLGEQDRPPDKYKMDNIKNIIFKQCFCSQKSLYVYYLKKCAMTFY